MTFFAGRFCNTVAPAIICLIVTFMASFAPAQPSTHKISALEASAHPALRVAPPAFRTKYFERKYMPSLLRPIETEGVFVYLKDKGVMWSAHKPVSMRTIINAEGVTQWIEGKKQANNGKKNRRSGRIADSVFAMFSGDVARLSLHFSFEKRPRDNGEWTLAMQPTSRVVRTYLQEILLDGDDGSRSVTIRYDKNRYSETRYFLPQIGAQFITDEERALLER